MTDTDTLRRGVVAITHMAAGQQLAKRFPLDSKNRARLNEDHEGVRACLAVVERTIKRMERTKRKETRQ